MNYFILPWQNLRRVVFKYISFRLLYNFSSCCYSVFSTDSSISHPWRISHIIYPLLTDLGPLFVDYKGHYSSACPIRRPSQSFVSCGNQDSIVQRSSPHKCGQRVWWGTINVVVTTIPPITSRLTSSLKLFRWSSSSTVWPPSGFAVRVYGLLGMIMASLALSMTRGTITLLNFWTPQNMNIYIYIYIYIKFTQKKKKSQTRKLIKIIWLI